MFIPLQTRRLTESFEGLKSSLGQLAEELCRRKDTRDERSHISGFKTSAPTPKNFETSTPTPAFQTCHVF